MPNAKARESIASVLDHVADAIAVLDSSARMHYANTRFESLWRELQQGTADDWSAPLSSAALAPVAALFRQALNDLRLAGLTARHAEIGLIRGDNYVAAITAKVNAGDNHEAGGPLLILIMRHKGEVQHERIMALSRDAGLTQAQTRVMGALASGAELDEIAAKLNVSIHTIRLHVKTILAKTGCRRQAELIHKISSISTGNLRLSI